MNLLIIILTFVLILVSLFMVLVVLIQKPRADSGLGAAMGGGAAEAAFGAETGNVLTRATIVSAVAFFVLSFAIYLGHLYVRKHARIDDAALPEVPAMVAPAEPVPAGEPVPTPNP
jgi:preprotein translocase subunit SecG